MTAPANIEREEGVPEWAKAEAVKRLNERSGVDYYSLPRSGENHTVIMMARLIAEREEEPGPAQALNEIIEKRYRWMNTGPFIIAELAERGFTIVPTEQVAK